MSVSSCIGWNTAKDGSGKWYNIGDPAPAGTTLDLYAVYGPITVNNIFRVRDGVLTVNSTYADSLEHASAAIDLSSVKDINTVTAIGDRVFDGLEQVTSIPGLSSNKIKSVGERAFQGCRLTAIPFDYSELEPLGNRAFSKTLIEGPLSILAPSGMWEPIPSLEASLPA